MVVIVSCHHFPDDERIYHKQIKSLSKTKNKILYFTRSNSNLNLSSDSITHINLSIKLKLSDYIHRILNHLKSMQDVQQVQIHEVDLLPLLKRIKYISPSTFTIYDVHENMEALYRTFSNRKKFIRELLIRIRNYNENRYLKYVDHVILANRPMFHDKYENQSSTIIENFPKLEYLVPLEDIKKRNKSNILYHGHLGLERGLKDLVLAMEIVTDSIRDASLSIVGTFRTKDFETEIKGLIKNLKLQDSINICSQVPHSDIWEVISNHKVGVIPFRMTPLTLENTPTKLFEMMICGLEIVVSKLPPAQHFIDNSVYWCEPGNIQSISRSIIKALNGKDDLSNIRTNQSLVKEKYNWETRQRDYTTLFKIK